MVYCKVEVVAADDADIEDGVTAEAGVGVETEALDLMLNIKLSFVLNA